MRSQRLWSVSLLLAGFMTCSIALFHSVLPRVMGWERGLTGVVGSLTWALFALNFSWSLLAFLTGVLVLYAATMGPTAGVFVRRTVFTIGLFWAIHGVYTWLHPMPMPPQLAWLKIVLGLFPAVVVALHWLPLVTSRRLGRASKP